MEALVALQEWVTLTAFLPQVRLQIDGNALLRPVCDRAEGATGRSRRRQGLGYNRAAPSTGRFEKLKLPFEVARTKEQVAEVVGGERPARWPRRRWRNMSVSGQLLTLNAYARHLSSRRPKRSA